MALRLHLRPPAAAAALCSKLSASRSLPARDRIIDFGKHKGRMLGSLPSSYLQWVSKNLRARDFEEWARLADEVLRDPVYRDRLEWEAAERILTGDTRRRRSSGPADSPVADLIEVSERFGWVNEDKTAWARIDFELLGTSNGGRIPRVRKGSALAEPARKSIDLGVKSNISRSYPDLSKGKQGASSMDPEDATLRADRKGSNAGIARGGRKAGPLSPLSKGHRFTIEGRDEEERGRAMDMEAAKMTGNREEMRQRRRFKKEQQLLMVRREVGVEVGEGRGNAEDMGEEIANPFPGRRALLEKARRRQFVE